MMRKSVYFILGVISVVTYASCNKVESNDNTGIDKEKTPFKIKTIIDNTKTTFSEGSVFSWEQGDAVSVQVHKEGEGYGKWGFTADTSSSSSELSSTLDENEKNCQEAGWTIKNFAFYPNPTTFWDYTDTETPTITINSSYTQNMTNPLSIVPMIGQNQGETFKFKVATGILKLSFSHALANVPQIELVSAKSSAENKYYLSGTFSLAEDGYSILSTNAISKGNTRTVYVPSLTNGSNFDVYIPVPVGTIPANDLKIAVNSYGLGYIVDNVFNPDIIEIKRGVVTSTPVIDIASVGTVLSKLPGRYKIGTSNYYITISALTSGDDPTKGNLKITAFEIPGSSTIEGTCYGTYDGTTGTITFPLCQKFAETGETYSDQPTHWSFRIYDDNYGTTPLALTINSAGKLAIVNSGKKMRLDKLQTPYESNCYNQTSYYFSSPITLTRQN